MSYHGGPVMGTAAHVGENTTIVVCWAPSGYSCPEYQSAVIGFLQDIAADSGNPTNAYAAATQYTDTAGTSNGQTYSAGRIAYNAHYGGQYTDTDSYPVPSGCPPNQCITDAQIDQELASFVNHDGLPADLGHLYVVLLPQNVSASTAIVSDGCAYHDSSSGLGGQGNLIYAVIPYPTSTCYGPGAAIPENQFTTPTQAAVDFVSHEHNEAITDPTRGGWYAGSSPDGGEIGDKCPSISDLSNETINGHTYFIQREWSNRDNGCVVSEGLPTPAFTLSPGSVLTGQGVSMDASGSSDPAPSGSLVSYAWDFGDGATSSGVTASHAYSQAGTYTVRLTVTDDGGWQATTTRTVSVAWAPPTNSSPPSILGQTIPGQTLSEQHGSWAWSPTGYSYQWEDCDQSGNNCAAIPGATGQSYRLAEGDVSHTIRVQEWASNPGGTGGPAVSAQTGVVVGPPAASFAFAPSSPSTGQAVSFDGSGSSEPNGVIDYYAWSFGDGTGGAGQTVQHAFALAGSYQVTLTVTDAAGRSASSTQIVVVSAAAGGGGPGGGGNPPGGGSPPGGQSPPLLALTGLNQSHSVWREPHPRRSGTLAKTDPPVGTEFSFTLNQRAQITLTFTRQVAGQMIGGRCQTPRKLARHARRCVQTLRVAALSVAGKAGANSVVFLGQLARSRWLPPGRYALTIAASTADGQHASSRPLRFTIVA